MDNEAGAGVVVAVVAIIVLVAIAVSSGQRESERARSNDRPAAGVQTAEAPTPPAMPDWEKERRAEWREELQNMNRALLDMRGLDTKGAAQ